MMARRICVFTGTRADYGLLRSFVLAVEASDAAELLLVVSGSHLSAEHGLTSAEIQADGVPIAAEVPIWSGDDSARQAGIDVGGAVARYSETLERLHPDVVVVLGDRLEAMAMALAATVLSVPVAHIHGGEVTEGAMDDALRHAITKLSYLHFTSTDEHRDRVVQLGEDPRRVHSLGSPSVDALASLELLTVDQVRDRFGVALVSPTALVTFHPAAMDAREPVDLVRDMLSALESIEGLHVIITGTNSDIGSAAVRDEIARYAASRPQLVDYVESFGNLGYLSAMAHSSVVVGNSSSVVLEAPLLGVPSVLVGDRQKGRPVSPSVLVPDPTVEGIANAISTALGPEFRDRVDRGITPFGQPGFAARALDIVVSADLPRPPRKRFFDTTRGVE